MTYARTISWTPKAEVAQAIFEHCQTKTTTPTGERYTWLDTNPQDLIRQALLDAKIIHKDQYNGDRSHWEPGQSIKVHLWNENHLDVCDRAKELGVSRQDLFKEVTMDYLQMNHGNS